MAVNSRAKGKNAELEIARILREYGFDEARRGQQFCGITGEADVVGVPGIHCEIKRREKLVMLDALRQSERDARDGEIPVVIHRRNREPWQVTMTLDNWIQLYRKATDGKR